MALTAALALVTLLAGAAAPTSGEELIRLMHATYAGRWYRTLTFVQTTTFPGKPTETWYEAGTIPGKLRIDVAPLDSMNAFMFVGDSSFVFKGGRRVAAQEDRNLLMTLGFDVYGQAPAVTIAQLKAQHVDLSRIREDTWQGAKVWVVGAVKGDTTSTQFWIEQDRLLFLRLIEAHKSLKNPNAPPKRLDVTFEGYRPLGNGWIETQVVIKLDGQEVQRERYAEIQADVPLQPDLYDTKTYRKAEWVGAPARTARPAERR